MALFGFGKDKKSSPESSEQVLAYLEDCQRSRTIFTLVGPKKAEVTGTIQAIDESEGQVTFQAPVMPGLDKGASVDFLFIYENLRLGGTGRMVEQRSGLWVVELPDALELRERRAQPRARLNPKEGTTLTLLTGLFEGVGITGVVENLSESGARVRVEKAMNIKGEKRLPLGTALVPPGQPFMLIKLNKAPKCPATMELEGRAVYLDGSAGGLVMGVAFDKPRPDFASAIRGLVASRTSAIPSAVPPKARRRPEAPPQEARTAGEVPAAGAATPARETPAAEPMKPVAPQAAAAPAAPAALPSTTQPAGSLPPESGSTATAPGHAEPGPAAPGPAAPGQAAPGQAAPGPAAPKNEAILRLRKRARAVVALAASPAAGDMLKDHLQEEGYGRVLVTASQKDLFDLLQQPNLGILLIDGNLSTLNGLALANQLRAAFPALPPVVLAVEDASTAIVLAAHRAGISQILVKPYSLDSALTDLMDQLI